MTIHPDDLLGRDLTFTCAADPGTIEFRVMVVAFDPARGWKLRGRSTVITDSWVSTHMLKLLLATGVLTSLLLFAPVASAQDTPTKIFAAAAAADWATTYRFLDARVGMVELNPTLAFARNKPVPTVLAGAAMDVVGTWAWNRYVGRKHPKIARVGLYAAAAFRIGLAVNNERRLRAARGSR